VEPWTLPEAVIVRSEGVGKPEGGCRGVFERQWPLKHTGSPSWCGRATRYRPLPSSLIPGMPWAERVPSCARSLVLLLNRARSPRDLGRLAWLLCLNLAFSIGQHLRGAGHWLSGFQTPGSVQDCAFPRCLRPGRSVRETAIVNGPVRRQGFPGHPANQTRQAP